MAALHEELMDYDAIIPMTSEEAESFSAKFIENAEDNRLIALEMYQRYGWRALGYESMEHFVTDRWGKSLRWLYNQVKAGSVVRLLVDQCSMLQKPDITNRTAMALAPLVDDPDELVSAWQEMAAEGGQITETRARQKVQQRRPPKPLTRREQVKEEWEQSIQEEREKHRLDPYYIQEQALAGWRALMSKFRQVDACLMAESLDAQPYAFVLSCYRELCTYMVDVESARAMQQEAD